MSDPRGKPVAVRMHTALADTVSAFGMAESVALLQLAVAVAKGSGAPLDALLMIVTEAHTACQTEEGIDPSTPPQFIPVVKCDN